MKIHSMFALALGLVAIPAAAQSDAPAPAPAAATAATPEIKHGDLVWSADGRRIGVVDSLRGTVVVLISDDTARMIYIPVATLSAGPRGLVSTLTRKEIARL